MTDTMKRLIDRLAGGERLTEAEFRQLIDGRNDASAAYLAEQAVQAREPIYGRDVFVRGLIEISSVCRNDCLYCGLRRSNAACQRYRLAPEDILTCCREGHALGLRTFVLQGGEDPFYTDDVLCGLLREIKGEFPDCALTLSLGERSRESYQRLFDAGADRYLLRHETADPAHYARLHPADMSHQNRLRCLRDLKDIGYQVGCGFMVGSPFQTSRELARDLAFIQDFRPHMCGVGPFIPHKATPLRNESAGTVDMTCFLLSVIRLIQPDVLLPATTALATLDPHGRERGMQSGANVVMPNLSPASVRKKYMLYDNKASDGAESAQQLDKLRAQLSAIGYRVVTDRGDHRPMH